MTRKTSLRPLFALLALLAAGLACNYQSRGSTPEPTLEAMKISIAGTATANASDSSSSGASDLATAQADATRRSQEVEATRTLTASTQSESELATATAVAPVLAELPSYNVDPEKGRVGWVHPPVDLKISGYQQFGYANDFMQVVAKDFVMAADVTWNTQYGASGCGFMFRSNGDKNKPDQYMLIVSRLGNGHAIFTAVAGGKLANFRDYYPSTEDKSFQYQNGSTNRLAVVGKGPIFEFYSNGAKIGEVDTTQPPPSPSLPAKPQVPSDLSNLDILKKYQNQLKDYTDLTDQVQSNFQQALQNYKTTPAVFDQGFVAMLALSESGETECKYNNAWLWLIEP